MSLRIKHLNADTSFLLLFSPYCAPATDSSASFPGSFTILLDPWLDGPSHVFHPKFANTTHVVPSCISSLTDLPVTPDLVLISQDKQDHCHRDTLTQLPPDTEAIILGTPAAVKKIRAWEHFHHDVVDEIQRYDLGGEANIHRIEIPSFSPSGTSGEVTVTLLSGRRDLTGLHNALGITYRAPSSVLTPGQRRTYIPIQTIPPTPPTTPPDIVPPLGSTFEPSIASSIASTTLSIISSPLPQAAPRPTAPIEPTISILYSPHGLPLQALLPWTTSHLIPSSALPLSVLIHPYTRTSNPWYLGGNITAGAASGAEIARRLGARVWVGAHDEEKINTGVSVKGLTTKRWGTEEIKRMLREGSGGKCAGSIGDTQLVDLDAGAEYVLGRR